MRWERNLALESKNGKEEHRPLVGELGNVLEKVLIDFGKLFKDIIIIIIIIIIIM